MSDHEIEIIDTRTPDGRRYAAICSCRRWRSKWFVLQSDAIGKGDAHAVRGDLQNRALAQFSRGVTPLRSELRWYEEQSENMLNSPKEREQWKLLADELRPRVQVPNDEGQDPLFS